MCCYINQIALKKAHVHDIAIGTYVVELFIAVTVTLNWQRFASASSMIVISRHASRIIGGGINAVKEKKQKTKYLLICNFWIAETEGNSLLLWRCLL